MNYCQDCEAVAINGIACHEHGCPSAYKDGRECDWCGGKMSREQLEDAELNNRADKEMAFCDSSCLESYY